MRTTPPIEWCLAFWLRFHLIWILLLESTTIVKYSLGIKKCVGNAKNCKRLKIYIWALFQLHFNARGRRSIEYIRIYFYAWQKNDLSFAWIPIRCHSSISFCRSCHINSTTRCARQPARRCRRSFIVLTRTAYAACYRRIVFKIKVQRSGWMKKKRSNFSFFQKIRAAKIFGTLLN